MSKKHYDGCGCDYQAPVMYAGLGDKKDNCCCSFPTLIVLILILLQFGKGKHREGKIVDNGILFIIAIFFLACCNPCKK